MACAAPTPSGTPALSLGSYDVRTGQQRTIVLLEGMESPTMGVTITVTQMVSPMVAVESVTTCRQRDWKYPEPPVVFQVTVSPFTVYVALLSGANVTCGSRMTMI